MIQSRVIQVVPDISEEASGPSYTVVRLCEVLITQGLEVTLVALDTASISSPPPLLSVFAVGPGPRRLGNSPRMYRWLSAQARTQAIDLMHAHSLWMMPNVYPGWVSRKYSVPLVISPRGTLSQWAFTKGSSIKRLFWPLLQMPALKATTCFHATANSEYEDIRRMGFSQPVAVIPNGVDIPSLLEKKASEHRTLLFLGRAHPKKGLDVLLTAWRAVCESFPEWRLRVVGPDNGGYLAQMRALASELRLTRVEFSGAVYGEHKWQAYRDADLFILPTFSENFGMAVAEALAAGIPAIVSKGAPWEGLETHGAGWWVDIGLDPLVECLKHALGKSACDLKQMGMRGRIWMEHEYSWQRIGQQMAETYRWILQGGGKPGWVNES